MLHDVLVPVEAVLDDALLRGIVHIDHAEALRVTVGPFKVVHQRPGKVADGVHAVFGGALVGLQIGCM